MIGTTKLFTLAGAALLITGLAAAPIAFDDGTLSDNSAYAARGSGKTGDGGGGAGTAEDRPGGGLRGRDAPRGVED